MNTTNRRHTVARLAAVATVGVALPLLSVVVPTVASAQRADLSGSATHRVGSVGTADVAEGIAYRKAQAAQYYVDHALELHQRAAR